MSRSILYLSQSSLRCPNLHSHSVYIIFIVSYAAIDAILNKSAESLDGCTMYMTQCPRTEEAKLIIQVGIKEVIYFHKEDRDDPDCTWAKQLLSFAKVWHTW